MLLVHALSASAQDCSVALSTRQPSRGSSVCIRNDNYSDDAVVEAAANRWNNACDSGTYTPTLDVGGCASAAVMVNVLYEIGNSPTGSCGNFSSTTSGGALTGGTITLYQFGIYTNTGNSYPCNVGDTLTHELGHVLGLGNAPLGSACTGHIMGQQASAGAERTIYPDDCQEVHRLWITSEEGFGGGGGGNLDPNMDDIPPGDEGAYDPRGESPIIVDVAANGYDLTSLDDGVRFDLDPDGAAERVSWTTAGSDDAFLALDRDGNGTIDDGTELFGNYTPQRESDAPNGFTALAYFDELEAGGDGDGVITARDAVFASLRLWRDVNHNGRSEPDELTPLRVAGLELFSVEYRESRRRDRYGNVFRYRGKVGGTRASAPGVWAWDVFLLSGD